MENMRFTLALEGDESGRHTRGLYKAVEARPSLHIDAHALLHERPTRPGEMSGGIADAIVFLVPTILALPGFVMGILEVVDRYRGAKQPTCRFTLTGPLGKAEITGDLTPEQLEVAVRALVPGIGAASDLNGSAAPVEGTEGSQSGAPSAG
ncbi:hypothetical protein ACQEVI_19480 [Promicromonospora sp. CA-289599]|uniref:hypothetical protein n=1 Tax=Promicromonospora sp. CA-289599 TaxID=3240014 RepID=UPI003D8A4D6E